MEPVEHLLDIVGAERVEIGPATGGNQEEHAPQRGAQLDDQPQHLW